MLRKFFNTVRRWLWMARIRWAMDRWFSAKERACRRFEKADCLVWRYDALFGEETL